MAEFGLELAKTFVYENDSIAFQGGRKKTIIYVLVLLILPLFILLGRNI